MHGKVSIQTVRKTIRQDPNTRKEIIVCPGGAYATLSAFEGEPVARFFAGRGWNASVCEYGVEEKARMPGPLLHLALAVAQARRKNDFVAVCGFSAGANLAALLCTRYEEAARLLGTKPEAVRPDAAVLGYGVYRFPAGMVPQPAEKFGQVSGQSDRLPKCFRPALRQTAQGDRLDFEALMLEYAAGRQDPSADEWRSLSPAELAGPETPPAFLWTTREDTMVPPEQSLFYAQALWAQGVPAALHLFSRGDHGEGLAEQNPESRFWPEMAHSWLLALIGTES